MPQLTAVVIEKAGGELKCLVTWQHQGSVANICPRDCPHLPGQAASITLISTFLPQAFPVLCFPNLSLLAPSLPVCPFSSSNSACLTTTANCPSRSCSNKLTPAALLVLDQPAQRGKRQKLEAVSRLSWEISSQRGMWDSLTTAPRGRVCRGTVGTLPVCWCFLSCYCLAGTYSCVHPSSQNSQQKQLMLYRGEVRTERKLSGSRWKPPYFYFTIYSISKSNCTAPGTR